MTWRDGELLTLKAKEEIARLVIRDALREYSRPAILWDGSKESVACLHLVRSVAETDGRNVPPVIFVDHGDHFPETFSYMESLKEKWNLNFVVAKNDGALNRARNDLIYVSDLDSDNRREVQGIGFSGNFFQISTGSEIRDHLLLTVPLLAAIRRYRFDSIFAGSGRHLEGLRENWNFISDSGSYISITPILTFLERDVWAYLFENDIPIHPKYLEGYTSVAGLHQSPKVSGTPAWQVDVAAAKESTEKIDDRERREIMKEKFRSLGYM